MRHVPVEIPAPAVEDIDSIEQIRSTKQTHTGQQEPPPTSVNNFLREEPALPARPTTPPLPEVMPAPDDVQEDDDATESEPRVDQAIVAAPSIAVGSASAVSTVAEQAPQSSAPLNDVNNVDMGTAPATESVAASSQVEQHLADIAHQPSNQMTALVDSLVQLQAENTSLEERLLAATETNASLEDQLRTALYGKKREASDAIFYKEQYTVAAAAAVRSDAELKAAQIKVQALENQLSIGLRQRDSLQQAFERRHTNDVAKLEQRLRLMAEQSAAIGVAELRQRAARASELQARVQELKQRLAARPHQIHEQVGDDDSPSSVSQQSPKASKAEAESKKGLVDPVCVCRWREGGGLECEMQFASKLALRAHVLQHADRQDDRRDMAV